MGTLTPEARTACSPIDCSAVTAAEAMSCSSALTRAVVQSPAITSVTATVTSLASERRMTSLSRAMVPLNRHGRDVWPDDSRHCSYNWRTSRETSS